MRLSFTMTFISRSLMMMLRGGTLHLFLLLLLFLLLFFNKFFFYTILTACQAAYQLCFILCKMALKMHACGHNFACSALKLSIVFDFTFFYIIFFFFLFKTHKFYIAVTSVSLIKKLLHTLRNLRTITHNLSGQILPSVSCRLCWRSNYETFLYREIS